MKSLNVLHSVASIDNQSAGPSYSVPRLVSELNALGHKAKIVTSSELGLTEAFGAPVLSFERDRSWPKFLRRLGASRGMRQYFERTEADVFHAHGLWMMSTIYPANAARNLGRPLLLAPRGMLGENALAFSRQVKRGFGLIAQNEALRRVSCFHATAESELEDIRRFGLRQPVAIVPNGIDLPDLSNPNGNQANDQISSPFVLSLGRIHPKKALDRLIDAFAVIAAEFPCWKMRIVGPCQDGYATVLTGQIHALGLADRISIEAPVHGKEKIALMRQAELFALPTLHENFAMTVAESLSAGTPVISTKGAPWSKLLDHRCGWWIDHGIEPLAAALRKAMALSPQERAQMGARGRDWMNRDFAWEEVAAKMDAVYSWLLGNQEKPDFVFHE